MGGGPGGPSGEELIRDPHLIVTDVVLSDDTYGDGDGVLEDGEVIEVTYTLTNIGDRKGKNGTLSAEWAAGVGDGFQWIVDEASVGTISPGGFSGQAGPLSFLVNTDELLAIGVYELTYSEHFFSQSVDELAVAANPLGFTRLDSGNAGTLARRNDRYAVWKTRNLQLWAKDMADGSEWMVDDLNAETLTLHGNWIAYAGGPWDAVWLRMANLETGEIVDVAFGEWWLVDKAIEPALNDRYLIFACDRDNVLFPPEGDEAPKDGAPPLRVLDLVTLTHRRVTTDQGIAEEWSPALDRNLLAFSKESRLFLTNLDDPPGSEIELYDAGTGINILDVELGEGYIFAVSRDDRLYTQELKTGEETAELLFGGLDLAWPVRIDVGDDWVALSNYDVLRLLRLDDGALVALQRHTWFDPAALYGKYLVYITAAESGWPIELRQEILPSSGLLSAAPMAVNQGVVVEADPAGDVSPGSPASFTQHGSYPNPFRGATTIALDMPHATAVDLRIYDATGRLVRKLVSDRLEAGRRQVHWDGRDSAGRPAAAGVYFYRLEAGELRETRKLVRLK
jgi:hypothetical protein